MLFTPINPEPMLPLPSGPAAGLLAEFPARIVFAMLPPVMPPPNGAWLPTIVLSRMIQVPLLAIPPPESELDPEVVKFFGRPTGTIHCAGINACKGQGSCAGADNSCKAQNGCKGKGWVMVSSAEECTKAGGKVVKEKKS